MLQELNRAADVIRKARALLITAGAGMGVDSGLPDFRGVRGFWRAYPPLKDKGLQLPDMSTPRWFHKDPHFAWGFFGHRYNLYNTTTPHDGFKILREWGETMDLGYFVFTSNVDGQFQKSGISGDRIVECHGSIHYLQCCDQSDQIWPMPEETVFDVDMETLRSKSPLPMGPPGENNLLARPNILMFNDFYFVDNRTSAQFERYAEFQQSLFSEPTLPFVVIEIGAGLSVPTVRMASESLVSNSTHGTLIRINPREADVPSGRGISLPMGGLQAIQSLQKLVNQVPE